VTKPDVRHVFISHSSLDRQIAERVCDFLERSGIRCWIAPRDLIIGTEWASNIVKAVDASGAMLLIFSRNANDSPDVANELSLAKNRKVRVCPLRLSNIQPTGVFEYYLSSVHWTDAFGGPVEGYLSAIIPELRRLLPQKSVETDMSTKSEQLGSKQKPAQSNASATISDLSRLLQQDKRADRSQAESLDSSSGELGWLSRLIEEQQIKERKEATSLRSRLEGREEDTGEQR